MGIIISFFRNFATLLGLVLGFSGTLTGFLVTTGASVAAFFSFINNDWFGWLSKISGSIGDLIQQLDPFMRALSYQKFFGVIYDGLAIDVFCECLVYLFTLFLGVIGFTCFQLLFYGLSFVIPFFCLKGLRGLISLFTVGQVRP